jgi:hypothetical protein
VKSSKGKLEDFMFTRSRILLVLIGLLAAAAAISAQDSRGRLLGRVTDSSGAVIVGVEVKAIHGATNVETYTRTNQTGDFELLYLPPGDYRLTVALAGFKTYVRSGLELRVADRLQVNVVLQPGGVTEVVTVAGGTPLLETAGASLGQVVDQRRLLDLPLNSGNAFTLVRLSPGVNSFAAPNHTYTAPSVEQWSNIAIGGTKAKNNEFTVDGAPAMSGNNGVFVPPADMVQEVKIETATYDVSTGHAMGGTVNASLRSGTNGLHGSLSFFHNDGVLQGLDFFQRRELYNVATGPPTDEKRKSISPPSIVNRYAAVVGGPVIIPGVYNGRNRTFWINGFEGFQRRSSNGGSYSTVPSLMERSGDFSQLLRLGAQYQIYDPATIAAAANGRFSRQQFPGNQIPASRLDPLARSFLSYWPAPNLPGSVDGRNNFFSAARDFSSYYSNTSRLDHNFSERHRVSGRYNQWHQRYESGQNFPNVSTGQVRNRYGKVLGVDDVLVLRPDMLLNVRYGLTRYVQTIDPLGKGFDLAGAGFPQQLVSLLDPQGITFPLINVDQYTALGGNPTSEYTTYHFLAGDLTKSHRSHSFRVGGEYRIFLDCSKDFTQSTPQIQFGAGWTRGPVDNSPAAPIGQGLASYLLGIPTGGGVNINASYADRSSFASWYVQDDWKVTRRLTVNAGLRYEVETPLIERYNRTVRGFGFNSPSPIEAAAKANYARAPIAQIAVDQFRVRGGLTYGGAAGQPRQLWVSDKNNFAPRVGLAYSLTRSTVLRAGYGIYFSPLGADRSAVNQSGYTQRTDLVASRDNGLHFIASLKNPFPDGILQPPGASGGLATSMGQAISFFDERPLNGYVQRWSFSVQRELPKRVLLETTYMGNRANKLLATRNLDATPLQYLSRLPVRDQTTIDFLSAQVANPFYPMLSGTNLAGTTVARVQLLLPYPQFTSVQTDLPNGYTWYHSLQVRAERRFSSGFTVQGAYTWSKLMEALSYLNAADPTPAKVISDNDRTQRLALSGIWELPFGPGKFFGKSTRGIFAKILGGWQVEGFYEACSGAPVNFGNLLFSGNFKDIGIPASERTLNRWFNTDGFERAAGKQLQYNLRTFPSRLSSVRNTGRNLWNLSGIKNFRLAEKKSLQIRGEWLNAFNHSHFAAPNAVPTNTLYGTVNSTSGFPLQIYLGAKLTF